MPDEKSDSARDARPRAEASIASTSYDLVAYPSYTHPQTHPDRLAVIGGLFGLDPAPATRCRVLELGCGNGTNLIPMAWALPQSEFTGIDLAAKPIAAGLEQIQSLAINNTKLVHGSITEIDQAWGEFDYIIAHGLYSWVPAEVREHILRICRDHLSPQGIAFVSYNALPGCHLRNMLREMLLFHVRAFESAEERIKQSVALVRFLADAQDTDDEYRLWMRAEANRIAEHSEGHLFHDELGEINDPLYFAQFMDQAARHGLQYLGEADFFEMSDHVFKDSVRQTLAQLSRNRILREQYMDFLKCRRFRQTLLCRHNAPLRNEPSAQRIETYFISSAAECTSRSGNAKPGERRVFETPRGAKLETDFALGQTALALLEEVWPQPLPFPELLQRTTQRNNKEDKSTRRDSEDLKGFLLRLYAAGIVEFRASAPTFTSTVSEYPVASPVARWQAARGSFVTSLFHIAVKVEDEIGRQLLTWLDGTHDRKALREMLWDFLKARNALNQTSDSELELRQKLAADLDQNLAKLSRLGLLVK